jgi:hypothetical protein
MILVLPVNNSNKLTLMSHIDVYGVGLHHWRMEHHRAALRLTRDDHVVATDGRCIR